MSVRNPKLTQAIADSGKSKTQIAADAGISKVYLWQLETGERDNPSSDYLAAVAMAVGRPVGELFGEWLEQVHREKKGQAVEA